MRGEQFLFVLFLAALLWPVLACGQDVPPQDRETVLDRKTHIEPELILDVPNVPPLCEGLALSKSKVDISGCALYTEQEGEGTPLVLLHGGPGATHHYFHPHFSRAAAFARMIYYDQRGCGDSEYKPGDGYSVEQAVDDLDRLRAALGIEKWVVLGHSYGGLLAQCYALKHPERLTGLVLVCASPGMPVPPQPQKQHEEQTPLFSPEERKKIAEIYKDANLSLAQKVFNAHLNGDWKRQSFYRPTREELAQMALYEWKHDPGFRGPMGRSIGLINLKGAFEACPIPTLILDSAQDLSWGQGKVECLHWNHPGAKLVVFERSAHSPFADEPEAFFQALGDFVRGLPQVPEEGLSSWKKRVAAWQETRSLAVAILTSNYGRAACEKLAKDYSKDWLERLDDRFALMIVGAALYDVKRYDEALDAFRKMSEIAQKEGDNYLQALALVWQGHMLDLLGRREEAVSTYAKAAEMNINGPQVQHGQYGLQYAPSPYARERMQTPFTRRENRMK
ncbi:MAG: alpha/beta fold hydrolase [Planctomycetota bacterium]